MSGNGKKGEKVSKFLKKYRRGVVFLGFMAVIFMIFGASCHMGAKTLLKDYREVVSYSNPDEGEEKHIIYYVGDSETATLSFRASPTKNAYGQEFPLNLDLWHREDMQVDNIKIDVLFPDVHSGEIYLQTFEGNPLPVIYLHRTYDYPGYGSTLEIPKMGAFGSGTVSLKFLAKPMWEIKNSTIVNVNVEAGLSEKGVLGKKYVLKCQTPLKVYKSTTPR